MKKCFPFLLLFIIISCSKGILFIEDKPDIKIYARQYESVDWQIRRKAIRKISGYRTSEAVLYLIKATDDTHPSIIIEALEGLSRFTPSEAFDKIKLLAEYEKNDNVRWYALKALAQYRDSSAAPIFVLGIKSSDWLIREESIRGLLMIDDFFVKYVCIPVFIKTLSDKKINVRFTTLEYLDIKDKRLYRMLRKMLNQNLKRNNTMLQLVLKALRGYILDKRTRKTLINLLVHSNKEVRLLSYRVLKEERRIITTGTTVNRPDD